MIAIFIVRLHWNKLDRRDEVRAYVGEPNLKAALRGIRSTHTYDPPDIKIELVAGNPIDVTGRYEQ
ncbi:hypothetical protein AB0I95_15195 [Micromonospora sp. NPDC049751]|uniref:hypothetical protein n=1 Tax=Micromonospora sp. NPDC049751 TaxID=3154837 RepID=UPI0034048E25